MKMSEEELLEILKTREDNASAYVHGQLVNDRQVSLREYYRLPYGNEEEGWSDIVTSDVQDTVEWVLPGLINVFTSTDKAVSFDPTRESDVKGAEQATDACNYVFYKQNNGFLILYTAIKDALTVRNCAVHWRTQEKEEVSSMPFKGADAEMLALLSEQGEIVEATPENVVDQMTGQAFQVWSGRIKVTEKKKIVKVEAFNPDHLLVEKSWTSPLLNDCPYVCRLMPVSLSDLKEMGHDVESSDLAASDFVTDDTNYTTGKLSSTDQFATHDEDESQTIGWLRIEYVLVDQDGDGIAERREIIRLREKILSNEICSSVQIATASPILNTHQWDGMSLAEIVSDLQKLHTELIRQSLNSLYLANNPRTKVLTDDQWNPYANIDDLLDSRPGAILRERRQGATQEYVTPWVGQGTLGMMEYVSTMRENRTGVTRYNQGIDANSLNKTATGINAIMTASQQRIELAARIFAETLLKPIFQGILKLLTEGGMEKLAFRLRDEFVEYDPNEWRDWYDMTINVGLGTGNTEAKMNRLMLILNEQKQGLPVGLATKKNIYNTLAKLTEASGFKNIGDFWSDPEQAQPDPGMLMQQLQQLQGQMQQMMADTQKATQENASLKLQLQNKSGELQIAAGELQLKAQEIAQNGQAEQAKNQAEVIVANIEAQSEERVKAMELEVQKMAQRIEMMQTVMQSREPVSVNVGGGKRKTIAVQAPSGQTYTGVIEEEGDE